MPGWEWVALANGIDRLQLRTLMENHVTVEQLWSLPDRELAGLPGMDLDLADRVDRIRRTTSIVNLRRRYELLGIRPIAWADAEYPVHLRHKPDAPALMFVSGQLEVDFWRCVAIVGTRKPTAYGLSVARSFARDLAAAGITIVSGMAYGIDAAAHRAALDAGGKTVAVMGCGLDVVYPRQHAGLMSDIRSQGAVVSEYPLGTKPLPHHFLERNRILAWLAGVVVVAEAGAQSGTMSTASHADSGNVKVFAVPGPITSPMSVGPNQLIRDCGATICTDALDIVQGLSSMAEKFRRWATNPFSAGEVSASGDAGPVAGALPVLTLPVAMGADVGEDAGLILKHLNSGSASVAEISHRTGLPVAGVAATVGLLEVRGLVKRLPGQKLIRV